MKSKGKVGKLGFCQLRDWEEGRTYNERPKVYTLLSSLEFQDL